jgi:hypothetical protein
MFDGRCLRSEVKMRVEVLDKKAEIKFCAKSAGAVISICDTEGAHS